MTICPSLRECNVPEGGLAETKHRCCESAPGILIDPHVGPVCPDCYASLTITRVLLEKIGTLVGIGACLKEADR